MKPNVPEHDLAEPEPVSPVVAARPLRRYIGRHNRQALLLAFFSLVAAVILWGAVYVFTYWFSLVGVTIVKGFNLQTFDQVNDPELISSRFPLWFAAGAVMYLGVAATIRRFCRMERVREARLYLFWVMLELFMAVPNVTFSVWGNLQAVTSLRKNESAEAWRLLHRINQEDGKLSLTSLRLVIDDDDTLNKVIFTLQIIGLVGVRENQQGWFLCLQGQDVRALLGRRTAAY